MTGRDRQAKFLAKSKIKTCVRRLETSENEQYSLDNSSLKKNLSETDISQSFLSAKEDNDDSSSSSGSQTIFAITPDFSFSTPIKTDKYKIKMVDQENGNPNPGYKPSLSKELILVPIFNGENVIKFLNCAERYFKLMSPHYETEDIFNTILTKLNSNDYILAEDRTFNDMKEFRSFIIPLATHKKTKEQLLEECFKLKQNFNESLLSYANRTNLLKTNYLLVEAISNVDPLFTKEHFLQLFAKLAIKGLKTIYRSKCSEENLTYEEFLTFARKPSNELFDNSNPNSDDTFETRNVNKKQNFTNNFNSINRNFQKMNFSSRPGNSSNYRYPNKFGNTNNLNNPSNFGNSNNFRNPNFNPVQNQTNQFNSNPFDQNGYNSNWNQKNFNNTYQSRSDEQFQPRNSNNNFSPNSNQRNVNNANAFNLENDNFRRNNNTNSKKNVSNNNQPQNKFNNSRNQGNEN